MKNKYLDMSLSSSTKFLNVLAASSEECRYVWFACFGISLSGINPTRHSFELFFFVIFFKLSLEKYGERNAHVFGDGKKLVVQPVERRAHH